MASFKPHYGFTLAELLISLAILAEIATFTIPKVLTSQQNGKYNAAAKEAASMVSAASQQLQYTGTVSASTTGSELTPYLNYVKYDTSGTQVDDRAGLAGRQPLALFCTTGAPCI